MGRGIRPTPEFRRESVRLALTSGRTRREIAEDLGIGLSTLTRQVKMSKRLDLDDWRGIRRRGGQGRSWRRGRSDGLIWTI